MADGRGSGAGDDDSGSGGRAKKPPPEAGKGPSGLPELMRRALSLGFSGFFLTEEAVRKALGDTLPKDWVDFAVEQSGRTRREFLERLSFEMGRAFENVDFAEVLRSLLEGRTLEVKAEIRLGKKDDRSETGIRIEVNGKRER